MPYSIKTRDGIEISGIPDGILPDDQRLKDEVSRLRAAGEKAYVFGSVEQAEAVQPQQPGMSFAEGAARGLSEGTSALIRGAASGAAGAVGVFSDPLVALVNQFLPEGLRGTTAVEGVNRLLTAIGVPESETEAQRLVQAASAGLAGAGLQAGAGQAIASGAMALGPSAARRVGEALASQPGRQVAGEIGANVATQAAADAGANPLIQLGAGLAGGAIGSSVGGTRVGAGPGSAPVAAAERAGINLMSSDVRPPQTFAAKWLQSIGEKVPLVGTGGMRKVQQAQRIEAVRDVMRQYGAEDLASASDDVMSDLLTKRKADLEKWTGYKNEVLEKLSASEAGPVPVTNALKRIDEQIEKLSAMKTAEVKPVIDRLQDWRQAIQGQDPATLNEVQRQIGQSFSSADMASVRSIGDKALSAIYGKKGPDGLPVDGLAKDMADYISTNGSKADLNKWLAANSKLSGMIDDLKLPALKAALDKGESTPEAIGPLLFSRKRSEVQALYRNLTPKGRASAKAAVIAKAAEEAGKSGTLNPDRFSAEIKKMGGRIGVLFDQSETDGLRGLTKVLDITKRAASSAEVPSTGIQTLIPAMYTALAAAIPGGPAERMVGATAAMSAVGVGSRLYESAAKSPTIRKVLESMPTLRSGSQEEYAAFKRLVEALKAEKVASAEGRK